MRVVWADSAGGRRFRNAELRTPAHSHWAITFYSCRNTAATTALPAAAVLDTYVWIARCVTASTRCARMTPRLCLPPACHTCIPVPCLHDAYNTAHLLPYLPTPTALNLPPLGFTLLSTHLGWLGWAIYTTTTCGHAVGRAATCRAQGMPSLLQCVHSGDTAHLITHSFLLTTCTMGREGNSHRREDKFTWELRCIPEWKELYALNM